MDWDAFFTLHHDLPREGPGLAEDVAFALSLAAPGPGAVICDAGAGPGGDIAALLAGAPDAALVAVDRHPGFVGTMRARFADEPRVTVVQADMANLANLAAAPFDLIWCAGALYFLGIGPGLAAFGQALRPGGVVAFSEPCHFVPEPSQAARDFWDGYEPADADTLVDRVRAEGWTVLGTRPVADAGWEAYYRPLEERIAALRPNAGAGLTEMLDSAAEEAATWRRVRGETGYLLIVARKA